MKRFKSMVDESGMYLPYQAEDASGYSPGSSFIGS